MILASIPSPADAVWEIGPIPIRGYALCIIAGVIVAIWLGERRWVARGGQPGTVSDMAIWAIPFGLVGARLYHVCTNPELYFSGDGRPIEALYIWEGGLGIWGAIALGALGAYIAARRAGANFAALADTLAPGILFAQAIGRWGNWFNQELYGKPLDRPWAVEIDPPHRVPGYEQYDTFHPTPLYESLWVLVGGFVLLWVARRFKIGYGRIFALYVMIYTAGRAWNETLRIDDAHEFGPFRLNVWTSILLFCLALAYFIIVGRRRPGREEVVQTPPASDDAAAEVDADENDDAEADTDSQAAEPATETAQPQASDTTDSADDESDHEATESEDGETVSETDSSDAADATEESETERADDGRG